MVRTMHWVLACMLAVSAAGFVLPVAAAAKAEAKPAKSTPAEDQAREIAQLQTLLRGELPEGVALAQLFTFDLLNDALIAEQRTQVEAAMAALGPAEAGAEPNPARQVLSLRLKILGSAKDLRTALVEADARRQAAQQELEEAAAASQKAEAEAQAAEAARKEALEAADQARTAAEKFFATELAKLESTKLEQAKLRQQLAERRVTLRSGEIESAGEQIRTRIQQAEPDAAKNRDLYDSCVVEVVAARKGLRSALSQIDEKIVVPRYVLPAELPGDASLAGQRSKLKATADELEVEAQKLFADTRRIRHDRAAAEYQRLERLNRSRIELLAKLQEPDREEILGLGPVGWEQFQREIEQLRLQFAWYRYARANLGFVWASVTEDTPRFLKTIWDAVMFALICIAAMWVSRRRKHWLDLAGSWAVQVARGEIARKSALSALSMVERVFPELLLLVVALLAPWALGRLADIAEIVLVLELFLLFAIYRLLLTVSYLLISWLSVGAGVFPPRLRALTLRSLRLTGAYVLGTLFVLVLSEHALGRGYLYSVVANIWWLGGIPIAAVLVRWWQSDIADGYLRFRETGGMASLVRATRERWYGFFVTVAAVSVLIVVAVGRLTARFALGFDQTRKALAFLFRRRLEKQAEQQGEVVLPKLDDELLKVLSEDPVDSSTLLVSNFPGLEEYLGLAKKWIDGGPAVPALLVGDTGFGKTTWLLAAEKSLVESGVTVHRMTPPANLTTAEALLEWLGTSLKLPHQSWDVLAGALSGREREAIIIDDGHRLFSRQFGGFQPWDALCRIAGAGTSRMLWMVAIARFPYDYLTWARGGMTAPFRRVLKLKPWSDTQIAQLLRTRMDAAGFSVRYDDLVAEQVEGVRQQTQLLRTETEYARLIWDYADGCPRTALRCWRASLIPAGPKVVSVRLFRRPDVGVVQRLSQRERFILAALVWHQTLTPELAAEVLRYPVGLCADTLALLRDWKVVGYGEGVYKLESDWLQPVRRLLRRENLIVM